MEEPHGFSRRFR
jgi:hypothetical protein